MTRTVIWKKRLALMAMGGCTFSFALSSSLFNCDRNLQNGDLQDFWTGLGTNSVGVLVDNTFSAGEAAGALGSDARPILAGPITTLGQAFWANYVFQQYPQDAPRVNLLQE